MISLNSQFCNAPQGAIDHQVSKDGRFGWFLCTWHMEKDVVLEEIQALIKLEILNSDLQMVSKLNIESWCKDFFADLHWKLHARFRKTDLREKGLSLFFGVLYDHELFFVQFGRMVCIRLDAKEVQAVGIDWRNHHVRSLEQLCLLGEPEKDIKIKVQRYFIPEESRFIVLTSSLAAQILGAKPDAGSICPLIEANRDGQAAFWLILEGKTRLLKPRKRRISRLEISTIILLFISILTIL